MLDASETCRRASLGQSILCRVLSCAESFLDFWRFLSRSFWYAIWDGDFRFVVLAVVAGKSSW